MSYVVDWFLNAPPELAVLLVAALPVIELRGAIPLGLALNIDPLVVLVLSLTGNILPLIPWYYMLKPIFNRMKQTRLFRQTADRFYERTMTKNSQVKKYGLLGLLIMVALPLPGTGGWTGMTLASFVGIKFHYALVTVFIGLMIASLLVFSFLGLGGYALQL